MLKSPAFPANQDENDFLPLRKTQKRSSETLFLAISGPWGQVVYEEIRASQISLQALKGRSAKVFVASCPPWSESKSSARSGSVWLPVSIQRADESLDDWRV